MRGAWKDIWASFKSVVAASALAFALALLGSVWDPGVKVALPIIWLAVFGFLVVSVIATAVKMTIEARRLALDGPLRVVGALVDERTQALTLVTRRSRQFGVNRLVTIYYEMRVSADRSDILEQAIGIGHVANVQENGLIQILVLREHALHASVWRRIRDKDIPLLSDVVVKPSIDFNAEGIEVRGNE